MKHTPGPWRLAGPQGWSVAAANNNVVAHCTTLQWESHDAKANARLIAACPELLEALDLILRTCEISGLTQPQVDAMYALIAKATSGAE